MYEPDMLTCQPVSQFPPVAFPVHAKLLSADSVPLVQSDELHRHVQLYLWGVAARPVETAEALELRQEEVHLLAGLLGRPGTFPCGNGQATVQEHQPDC